MGLTLRSNTIEVSLIFVVFFSASVIPAFAQTTVNEEVAGIVTPDNPFYIFDVFGDDFILFITTEPNEKALLGLQIANERLAEIDFSIERGDVDSADRALEEHTKTLDIVEESVAISAERDPNVVGDTSTETDLDEEFEKTLEIEAMLTLHRVELDVVKEKVRIILQANQNRLASNQNLPSDRLEQITSGLDNAIEQVEVRVDAEKTRIKVRFADDFDKSSLAIMDKTRTFETMAGNNVEIRLSNSGQGSFSSGSDSSGSGSSGSSRSGSNSGSG